MIAHIREPKRRPPSSALIQARRLVASALLPARDRKADEPPFAYWKLGFYAGMVLSATAAYLAYRLALMVWPG